MSLGIFQVFISSLVNRVIPVMLHKMVQSSVVCNSVCLHHAVCKISCVAVLTLLIPIMDVCVWVFDKLKRYTHLSMIKCDWETLSNNALHGINWPNLFWISTMTVASKMWFCACTWMNNTYWLVQLSCPVHLQFDCLQTCHLLIESVWSCVTTYDVCCDTTHDYWTCVVLSVWLQTFEAESWLFGIIEALFLLHFEIFVTMKQSVWSIA